MEFGQQAAEREAPARETSALASSPRRAAHPALVRALELRAETALLRLDAEMALDGETDPARRDVRLLTALGQALGLAAVAFLPARPGRAAAATAPLSPEVIDRLLVLPGLGGAVDDPVRASIQDGRVRLLARGTTHPLLGGLREIHDWIEALAVLPLRRPGSEGALLLFSADIDVLRPELLAGFGGVAHCVAVLLAAPSEGAPERADESAPGGEAERAWVEVEELRHRLREAAERESTERDVFQMGERELRAEVDSMQLRLAESQSARAASAEQLRAVEAERDALATECAAAIARNAVLERALDAVPQVPDHDVVAMAGDAPSVVPDPALRQSGMRIEGFAAAEPADPFAVAGDEAEPPVFELSLAGDETEVDVLALDVTDVCDPADGEMDLTSALAEEDDSSGDGVVSAVPSPEGGATPEAAASAGVIHEAAPERACHRALVLVEQSGVLRERAARFAGDRGFELWQDDAPLPSGGEALLIANLLDRDLAPTLARVAAGPRCHRAFAYAHDPEADAGCVLGLVDWLARPVQSEAAESALAAAGATRGASALVVSSQMRELGGVREALVRLDTAGSVAFDARQAVDLLDIIRRPSVLVVDLAPDPTRGLALVLELRRDERVASTPMVLLLPEPFDPDRLRREALRGGLLAPAASVAIERLIDVATRDAA